MVLFDCKKDIECLFSLMNGLSSLSNHQSIKIYSYFLTSNLPSMNINNSSQTGIDRYIAFAIDSFNVRKKLLT